MTDYDFTRSRRAGRGAGPRPRLRGTEDPARPKFYCLEMLPYPSGDIHVGPRPQLLHHRRGRPLQADARVQRPAPDRLGRPRPARRERRHQAGRPSREVDARQHRGHEAAAPAPRLQLSLEPRDRDLRPRVLPLEPVVLPAHARAGHRLPGEGAGQLVPVLPDRARQRAGRGRARAGAARARSSSARWTSGSSASRPTRTSSSTTWRSSRPGPTACSLQQRNWVGRSHGRRGGLPGRGRRAASASSRRASTRSTARPSWSWPPSTRAWTSSCAGRRTRREARAAIAAPARPGPARAPRGPGREGRRLHRPLRHEPLQRRADPDLGRQLRAHGLRHGRHHVRARPRRSATSSSRGSTACPSAS